jgi:hypothetical protein
MSLFLIFTAFPCSPFIFSLCHLSPSCLACNTRRRRDYRPLFHRFSPTFPAFMPISPVLSPYTTSSYFPFIFPFPITHTSMFSGIPTTFFFTYLSSQF